VIKVNEVVKKQEQENNNGEEVTGTPKLAEIIVANEPTELLQTDGEPEYKAISELLCCMFRIRPMKYSKTSIIKKHISSLQEDGTMQTV
jgi:hypothetical protein